MEIIGSGKYVRLVRRHGWECVERVNASGIVCMVPLTDDDKVVLIEQFRRPLNASVIEMPAGLVGDTTGNHAETVETAAQRELIEETGYQAKEFVLLIEGPPSAGLSSEIITFFLARGLTKVGSGGGDDTEDIIVHEIPVAQVHEWLEDKRRAGMMVDPKIYTGLYFLIR